VRSAFYKRRFKGVGFHPGLMIAKSAAQLLRDYSMGTLIQELVLSATLSTPSRAEAEKLTALSIK
jgi:hydroxymethylpyrimidine/phosphomethylpyrimidine kinase